MLLIGWFILKIRSCFLNKLHFFKNRIVSSSIIKIYTSHLSFKFFEFLFIFYRLYNFPNKIYCCVHQPIKLRFSFSWWSSNSIFHAIPWILRIINPSIMLFMRRFIISTLPFILVRQPACSLRPLRLTFPNFLIWEHFSSWPMGPSLDGLLL